MSATPATYYDLLGISPRAQPDVVRTAYRRLAQKYHPDKQLGNAQAERVMSTLNEAYAVLSDPARRAQYDRAMASAGARSLERRNRRFAEVRETDAAWPWWLLFATISLCAAAVGVAIYKGYVPGAAGPARTTATPPVVAATTPPGRKDLSFR